MTAIIVRKLRCSKCGGAGYKTQYETFDGTVRLVVRCSNCGHEKIEHEYKRDYSGDSYSIKQSDEIEMF